MARSRRASPAGARRGAGSPAYCRTLRSRRGLHARARSDAIGRPDRTRDHWREVVEVGEAGTFAPGDRVFVPAQISCGACGPCRSGSTGRCASVPFAASYGMGRAGDFGGGLADLVRVPFAAAMLSPVPAGADVASLIGAADMAADAWRGIGPHLKRRPGARVLVIGGMPAVIVLYAAGIAKALGAGAVDYLDGDPARDALAAVYGARRSATSPMRAIVHTKLSSSPIRHARSWRQPSPRPRQGAS